MKTQLHEWLVTAIGTVTFTLALFQLTVQATTKPKTPEFLMCFTSESTGARVCDDGHAMCTTDSECEALDPQPEVITP